MTPVEKVPAARLWVRVKPRSRTTRILGWTTDGFLEVQLQAVPDRGAANRACRKELARALGVARDRVVLETGQTSRLKRFSIHGVSDAEVRERIDREKKGGGPG